MPVAGLSLCPFWGFLGKPACLILLLPSGFFSSALCAWYSLSRCLGHCSVCVVLGFGLCRPMCLALFKAYRSISRFFMLVRVSSGIIMFLLVRVSFGVARMMSGCPLSDIWCSLRCYFEGLAGPISWYQSYVIWGLYCTYALCMLNVNIFLFNRKLLVFSFPKKY